MKKLLPIVALLLAVSAWAQAPKFEWVRPIPAGVSTDGPDAEYYDFRTDPAGNTYLYGLLYGKTDFGNNVVLLPPQADDEVLFLVKFDPKGKALWGNLISTETGETDISRYMDAPGLELDAQGNIYVSGGLGTSVLNFGDGVQLKLLCQFGCANAFVAKYNPDGKALWAKKIEGGDSFEVQGAKLATDGDFIYLFGSSSSPMLDFGDGLAYTNQKPGLFLAKLRTSDGKGIWAKFISSTDFGFFYPTQLTRSPSGDLWLSGNYGGTIDFGNGLTLPAESSAFFVSNQFIARYSSDGTPAFAVNLNASYLDVLDIAWVPDFGGLYVLTNFSDTLRTGKDVLFRSTDQYTSSLLYLNPNGFSEVLSIAYANDGYAISGVTAGADGDYYVSGYANEEDLNVGGIVVPNVGCFDGMLAKGNLAAEVEWARGVGGTGCEAILGGYYGKSMGLDAKGDLFLGGGFIEGMNFDNVTSSGSGLVVAKLKTGTVSTAEPA
ncbi:MAG TPA: hypothetical protein PK971_00800, partial [Saprospiraceae bacterium]|nr:hypothetical protein [Saprospiraceae bacterium]